MEATADRSYRHIVIDGAQDLSPDQWRLLRAAVPEAPDDLFIAGDTHQRIYHNRASFREVGVNVAGRSSRLNLNYRTTAEILGWSMGLLHGQRIDDIDGGLDSIAGCTSHVHGSEPRLQGASSAVLQPPHATRRNSPSPLPARGAPSPGAHPTHVRYSPSTANTA